MVPMNRPLAIVLTGGPGGGKTTLIDELCTDPSANKNWISVPEAGPLLFRAGLDARQKSFERATVRLQIALEESISQAASPHQVLLCHRGTLDPLAYWLRNGWLETEFFSFTGMTREQHHRRYFGVIHLQTAAIGASEFYHRWPDSHRPETIEQAAAIDRLCCRVWQDHPRYFLIDNTHRNWPDKGRAAREVMARWLIDSGHPAQDVSMHGYP
jgi:hypothetical protein